MRILAGCAFSVSCPKVVEKDGQIWVIGYAEYDADVFAHVDNGEAAVIVPIDVLLAAADKLKEKK